MKAFALKRYSKSNGVAEVDVAVPQLRAGDVLVQVCAASLNPLDLKIRNGELKSLLPYKLPLYWVTIWLALWCKRGLMPNGSSMATTSMQKRAKTGLV